MLDEFEKPLWEQGYRSLAGIDEVGRGCLFGDVVAAAVILPEGLVLDGIAIPRSCRRRSGRNCTGRSSTAPKLGRYRAWIRPSWTISTSSKRRGSR